MGNGKNGAKQWGKINNLKTLDKRMWTEKKDVLKKAYQATT